MEEILNKAEIIYNYLNTKDSISKSDVVLGCGSIDNIILIAKQHQLIFR